jgi:hypothetical protein
MHSKGWLDGLLHANDVGDVDVDMGNVSELCAQEIAGARHRQSASRLEIYRSAACAYNRSNNLNQGIPQ